MLVPIKEKGNLDKSKRTAVFFVSPSLRSENLFSARAGAEGGFYQSPKWAASGPNRDWHFGFETSRFREFGHLFAGFGEFGLRKKSRLRFRKIWSKKKVLVSVLENLVSGKKSQLQFWRNWSRKKSIGFGKFGLGKKVSVSVLENLVSEKTVSVSVKILVSSFSGPKSTMHYMQHEL